MSPHAWNDALALAQTLKSGQAVKANDLLMVREDDRVTAWGDCPLSGLVLLDAYPEPVYRSEEIETFLKMLRTNGKKGMDFAPQTIVKMWREYLNDGFDIGQAIRLAKEGM